MFTVVLVVDDYRQRAVLRRCCADAAAKSFSLPTVFHFKSYHFLRANSVHTAGQTAMGGWMLLCLGQRV